MRKLIYAIPLAAVAVLAFAQQDTAPDIMALKGKAVTYSMTDVNGKTVSNQTLKGKVVLIDFWATWCGPCKAAAPTIQMLHEKYGSQGFVAIGANAFERTDPDGAAAKYAADNKYTYLMTVKNDTLARSWGVRGIPAFIIIGKDGVVELVQTGFGAGKTDKVLEDAVRTALAR